MRIAAYRQLAKENAVCNVRFEELGPSRLLRGLGKVLGTRHVSIAGAAHAIDIDLADGLVVGAYASAATGPAEPVQGPLAILQLWDIESGEVEIRKQDLPSIANIMSSIDETLGAAVKKLAVSEGWQIRGLKLASTVPPPNDPMPSYRVRLEAARKRQSTRLGMPSIPVPKAMAQAKAFEGCPGRQDQHHRSNGNLGRQSPFGSAHCTPAPVEPTADGWAR